MKKKWELIKEAYDRYPKGAKAFWVLGKERILSGEYELTPAGDVFDAQANFYLYDQHRWATIVETEQKPDLLEGKVAIRVNDGHEFKALMKHYEQKGWKWKSGNLPVDYIPTFLPHSGVISYEQEFTCNDDDYSGYKTINFPDFAAHVGIEVRKPLLRSEDDVGLFEGDDYHAVRLLPSGKWEYCAHQKIYNGHLVIQLPGQAKAFSTREAAEAWVADKNPKEIVLFENRPSCPTVVLTSNGLYRKEPYEDDVLMFLPDELEEIYAAHQKMQGGEHGA